MIYRFASCELDVARQELRRDGRLQPLEPQVLSVLVFLVENRHRVVTKAELFDEVWEGRIVSDSALSSRIKTARQAIGDSGRRQALIRTLHGRGFRFVGEAALASEAEPLRHPIPSGAASGPRDTAKPSVHDGLDLPGKPSVAVLPFEILGDAGEEHILADGLTQDIITRLGRTRWLFVIARGSAFRFRGRSDDVAAIAAKLGVRYVAQGTLQFAGRRVRVNATLCDAAEGAEVWAEGYDRELADIFALQDEIANAVAGAIASEIDRVEQRKARLRPPESLDAWGAYHRGCWHLYRYTATHCEHAERFFKRSAALDPHAPRTFAGLSFVHWQRAFLSLTADRGGEIRKAFDYARHALSLDQRDPLAHWALGRAFEIDGEVEEALQELGTAVSLNPSSAIGHYARARTLMIAGDSAASLEAVERAWRLSPYDPMTFAMLSVRSINLSVLGRHEEAAALAGRAARQPNAHYHMLATSACIHRLAGRDDLARDYLARLRAVRPDYRIADYFRAFPYRGEAHVALSRDALKALGMDD